MPNKTFIFPQLHTQIIRGSLVLLIAGFIVFMTSQPAIASTESSQFIATGLAKVLLWMPFSHDVLLHWGLPTQVASLAPALDHAVRKTAHFTEYAALGFVVVAWLRHTSLFHRHAYWLAVLAGGIFAISDEWHQSFVPGRSCQITDMMIDITGCLTGVLIYFAIKMIVIARRNKKSARTPSEVTAMNARVLLS